MSHPDFMHVARMNMHAAEALSESLYNQDRFYRFSERYIEEQSQPDSQLHQSGIYGVYLAEDGDSLECTFSLSPAIPPLRRAFVDSYPSAINTYTAIEYSSINMIRKMNEDVLPVAMNAAAQQSVDAAKEAMASAQERLLGACSLVHVQGKRHDPYATLIVSKRFAAFGQAALKDTLAKGFIDFQLGGDSHDQKVSKIAVLACNKYAKKIVRKGFSEENMLGANLLTRLLPDAKEAQAMMQHSQRIGTSGNARFSKRSLRSDMSRPHRARRR